MISQTEFCRAVLTSVAISAIAYPSLANAQEIPTSLAWLIFGAPFLTFIVAVVAGIVARSWVIAFAGIGLVAFWIAFYLFAAEYLTADAFFWAPVVGLHLQLVATVLWLFWRIIKSIRYRND